jgi:hypothetical protein
MSTITHTKKLRILDWEKDRGLFRREKMEDSAPRKSAGICPHCEKPVFVSAGQIINRYKQKDGSFVPSHKICRKLKKYGWQM